MPEVRRFIVTQEREVEITAEDPTEAARLADIVFREGPKQDAEGNPISGPVRITTMQAREHY